MIYFESITNFARLDISIIELTKSYIVYLSRFELNTTKCLIKDKSLWIRHERMKHHAIPGNKDIQTSN